MAADRPSPLAPAARALVQSILKDPLRNPARRVAQRVTGSLVHQQRTIFDQFSDDLVLTCEAADEIDIA